ncbi:MAG: DUF6141 family protein [Bacteroidales bacterium]|jgi:hypothetical protein|nr:DUF6141 family protein [Bacteroidales bacterium]
METKGFFKETQRYKQWWIWIILLCINGLFFYGIIKQIIIGEQWGDKPMSNTGLWVAFGFTLLLTILFACFRLETRITDEGVYVRFFPFQLTYKKYSWDEISKSYVRRYHPIGEYGGWGVRYGRKGKAYNVSGNKGLQLEFVNGKCLLIGTNKPIELEEVLNRMKKSKQ